jgi:GNAT superfamily N-acetyltransferase
VIVDVVRTYLELRTSDQLRRADLPPGAIIEKIEPTVGEARALYRDVGARWHWRDRDRWPDAEYAARLASPRVSIHVLRIDGILAGFFEFERHDDGSVEIVLFGLLEAFIGRRLGRSMLTAAVDAAWALGANRVWLHTCTLDSPRALPNYLARGLEPFRTETYQANVEP